MAWWRKNDLDDELLALVESGELEHVTEGGQPRAVPVETVERADTLSGYPAGSYPDAQANGQQFDDDRGLVNPVRTGKQEEALLNSTERL